MENFIIIISYLLIGILLKQVPSFPKDTGKSLNLFVIYVSLPALILLKIPELIFTKDLLTPMLMPWGVLVFSCLLVLVLARFFHWDRSTTGCLLLLIPIGNTSFLGIPMVETFFGKDSVSYALLYDQLGSFLALATYGTLIIALYGEQESKASVKSVIKKVLSFPPFISLVLAFIVKEFTYPLVINNILEVLSATLIPVVMIAVGYQLSLRLNKEVFFQLSLGLSTKLLIIPIIVLFFCKFIGLEGHIVEVSIFEASMPPQVSAGALAIVANLAPNLTAALVGVGIVASFITLPIMYHLIIAFL